MGLFRAENGEHPPQKSDRNKKRRQKPKADTANVAFTVGDDNESALGLASVHEPIEIEFDDTEQETARLTPARGATELKTRVGLPTREMLWGLFKAGSWVERIMWVSGLVWSGLYLMLLIWSIAASFDDVEHVNVVGDVMVDGEGQVRAACICVALVGIACNFVMGVPWSGALITSRHVLASPALSTLQVVCAPLLLAVSLVNLDGASMSESFSLAAIMVVGQVFVVLGSIVPHFVSTLLPVGAALSFGSVIPGLVAHYSDHVSGSMVSVLWLAAFGVVADVTVRGAWILKLWLRDEMYERTQVRMVEVNSRQLAYESCRDGSNLVDRNGKKFVSQFVLVSAEQYRLFLLISSSITNAFVVSALLVAVVVLQ
ncbi:MAG: hypothetical protein MHM6MM_006500 [Cercozoa sp. M6MM]